jgi:hypothetical protein
MYEELRPVPLKGNAKEGTRKKGQGTRKKAQGIKCKVGNCSLLSLVACNL